MTSHRVAVGFALVASALASGISVPLAQEGNGRSPLWGHAGELWDPIGRLPDYSHAGYRGGDAPLPTVPMVANVLAFGAVGNGVTDDVRAFRKAIAFVAELGTPGAILVPTGTYVIGDILEIDVDGVVLRGEASGKGGSVLYFPTPGVAITGQSMPWIHGQGGLIHVGDLGNGNAGLGALQSSVTAEQVRGDRTLRLASANGIQPGDYVVLELRDDPGDTLAAHIHNDQASGGTCSYQPLATRWPVQVESVSANVLTLAQPLRLDVRQEWSPRVYAYTPVREVGLESLHMAGRPHVYPGHLLEDGYNPVTFDGALNCWMDDVTFEYVDNGPSLVGMTKHCTLQNLTLQASTDAHHGVSFVSSVDCLVQDFGIEPLFRHSITVDHQASGNVVRRGFASDLYLDHHRDGSYENLFTDLDAGLGTQPWYSGGSTCAGPRAGARNTYWNVHSASWFAPPNLPTNPEWAQIQSNLIPARIDLQTANNEWYELQSALDAQDLYGAQLERRQESEVLTSAGHTVVTFEDGTSGALGQEEGEPAVFGSGGMFAQSVGVSRWVDPTALRSDQEILFEISAGFPRSAHAGVQFQRASTGAPVGSGPHVYLERVSTPIGQPSEVVLHLADAAGILASSPPLELEPDLSKTRVRVRVFDGRLLGEVQNQPALDYTGLPPNAAGYTAFFLRADEGTQNLGFDHVQVMSPGPSAEVHVDGDGTLWLTLFEEGLGLSPDPGKFAFLLNQNVYTLSRFWMAALPYSMGLESRGANHMTLGFRAGLLPPGERLGIFYGALDEAFVPWWR